MKPNHELQLDPARAYVVDHEGHLLWSGPFEFAPAAARKDVFFRVGPITVSDE